MKSLSNSLLPIAIKISAQTIGLDLVSVVPMSSPHSFSTLSKENAIKRNNKFSKITDGKVIDESKSNSSGLFYLDFKY